MDSTKAIWSGDILRGRRSSQQVGIGFVIQQSSLAWSWMQFLFKKYLDYEKAQGNEEGMEHVKTKAMEYVDAKLGWFLSYF